MSIGESMRAARMKADLTQQQLSERSGVPKITISVNERGVCNPKLFTVIDLADALGITIDEYIGHGVREMPAEDTPQEMPQIRSVSPDPVPFKERVREILDQRGITVFKFTGDTGIDRVNFFHRESPSKRCRHIYMGIAYYFDMDVEELVAGTDAEKDWYGDYGI